MSINQNTVKGNAGKGNTGKGRAHAHKPVNDDKATIGVPANGAAPVVEPVNVAPVEPAVNVASVKAGKPVNDDKATIGPDEISAIERNVLRRLFTGDKAARSIMLDVVTDLATSPDKDGNAFDIDRNDVGARIPKGIFTGILKIAKGQYDNTHVAYALGKTIGGKAAVKAGGKDDVKAIAEAAAFLDISNSLPNLIAGIRNMTATAHGTAEVMRRNDVDKVPAFKATASERLAVVEKAQNGDDKAIADYLARQGATPVKAKKSA